jgi:hypothetical protein
MTGSDLASAGASSILSLVLGIAICFVLIGGGTGYYLGKKYNPHAQTEPYKDGYKDGYIFGAHKGILIVVNYDRKNAGQEQYSSYEEFQKDLDVQAQKAGELEEFMNSLIKERKEADAKKALAAKAFPKPWVKKE